MKSKLFFSVICIFGLSAAAFAQTREKRLQRRRDMASAAPKSVSGDSSKLRAGVATTYGKSTVSTTHGESKNVPRRGSHQSGRSSQTRRSRGRGWKSDSWRAGLSAFGRSRPLYSGHTYPSVSSPVVQDVYYTQPTTAYTDVTPIYTTSSATTRISDKFDRVVRISDDCSVDGRGRLICPAGAYIIE